MIPFIATAGEYIIIVQLIGGNDLFEGNVPSTFSPKVADEIKVAADRLTLVANKVFVIGIPQ